MLVEADAISHPLLKQLADIAHIAQNPLIRQNFIRTVAKLSQRVLYNAIGVRINLKPKKVSLTYCDGKNGVSVKEEAERRFQIN